MLETQVLQVQEISTDIEVETTQVETAVAADQCVKDDVAAEDEQELPNTCALSLEPMPITTAGMHIKVETTSKDHIDVIHNEYELSKSTATICTIGEQKQKQTEVYECANEKDTTVLSQSQGLCTDQSPNVITVCKAEVKKETANAAESDRNVIEDVNQLDAVSRQYSTSNKFELDNHSRSQTRNARDSVKETIREIRNNDSSQNSSIVIDAELSKLVQDEAVVVVVETIPVITDATANEFVVALDEKDANKECDHGTVASLQEKKLSESEQGANEISLLDYCEENDDTIIEVTKVIDAPIMEQCEQRDNKDHMESNKYDVESVKITDGKVAIDENINGKNGESHMANRKDNNITIIIDKKIIIAENDSLNVTKDASEIEDTRESTIEESKFKRETISPCRESSTADSSMKKRSVIQDIFDDWGVENTDEDVQSPSKVHDSVEIELKSLLDETKTDQTVTGESLVAIQNEISSSNEDRVADKVCDVTSDATDEKDATKQSIERAENQKKKKAIERDAGSSDKNEKNSSCHLTGSGKSSCSIETRALNSTTQSYAVSKNHSRHLTSQIASPAEVTEVLKQRLREKQKTVVDTPRGPDIFFVKKLTQRLSSRLAGNPKNSTSNPGLAGSRTTPPAHSSSSSPSFASAQSATDNCDKKTEISKSGNSDNKELLAILEGDDDPDWSVLNPPTLTEESKSPLNVEPAHSPPKLDPLLERELALKQLLELPVKKTPSRKRKTFQPAPGKAKDAVTKSAPITQTKKHVDADLESENARPNPESTEITLCATSRREHTNQKDRMTALVGMRADESRSGRKRKPTEKAREHEQNTMKRQKVYRGKVAIDKKQAQEDSATTKVMPMKEELKSDDDAKMKKETIDKEVEDKPDPIPNQVDSFLVERPKQNLTKKGPIAKRKAIVKRLLRTQKMPSNAKSVQLKTKLNPTKKSPPKIIAKSQKRTSEGTSGDAKPKKKNINEIDKLLQDEGVVNLLYDVEQPTKKRLIPITKSRAKVMDLQKVQRELKIRKKLVRNAVLRLRTSTTAAGAAKVSPRSKRTAVYPTDVQLDKKMGEQTVVAKTSNSAASPTEFILPAKIRNAADASIIVRRHSSSSFSSASGSPRVSVDSPGEKLMDMTKPDDGAAHSLRSAKKRRDSQDEKISNAKKSKKRKFDTDDGTDNTINTLAISTSSSDIVSNDVEEKITVAARPSKKSDVKKMDKTVKQESVSTLEDNVSSKVTTRSSNGAVTTGKVTAKSKRAAKSKVTFARANEPDNNEESSKEEDELSVCLAEAATALSVVNARSSNITRKSKGNLSICYLGIICSFSLAKNNYRISNIEYIYSDVRFK